MTRLALTVLALAASACGAASSTHFAEFDRGEGDIHRVVQACTSDAWQLTVFTSRAVRQVEVELEGRTVFASAQGDHTEEDGAVEASLFFVSIPVVADDATGMREYDAKQLPFSTTPCSEDPGFVLRAAAGAEALDCVSHGATEAGCTDLGPFRTTD